MKPISFIIIILTSFIADISFCQDNENFNELPQKIGYTVWEFAPIGVGINHTYRPKRWKPSKYLLSYCISGYQANMIIASNDKEFHEFQYEHNGLYNRIGLDFIKFKYSVKRNITQNFDVELSLFTSLTFTPSNYEGNFFPAYGIESSIYYFNFGRVSFATSAFLTKSFMNQNIYFQITPLKVLLRIRSKDYKHLM